MQNDWAGRGGMASLEGKMLSAVALEAASWRAAPGIPQRLTRWLFAPKFELSSLQAVSEPPRAADLTVVPALLWESKQGGGILTKN